MHMTKANPLTNLPRGRHLSTLLYESNWRRLADFEQPDDNGRGNSVSVFSKNGRIVVVEFLGVEGEHGVELFYPSGQQKIADLVVEANAYAMDAVVTIPSNKAGA